MSIVAQRERVVKGSKTITPKACISSMRSTVYHQHEVLYLIKPTECTLRVMRYKAVGLDFLVRETELLFCGKATAGKHLAVFSGPAFQVPPSDQKRNPRWLMPPWVSLVRETGLEPVRITTRPSNVRVCQFRHSRENIGIIAKRWAFVKGFLRNFLLFFGKFAPRGAQKFFSENFSFSIDTVISL